MRYDCSFLWVVQYFGKTKRQAKLSKNTQQCYTITCEPGRHKHKHKHKKENIPFSQSDAYACIVPVHKYLFLALNV